MAKKTLVSLNLNLPGTEHIYFLQRNKDFEDEDNKLMPLPEDLLEFIFKAPKTSIHVEDVKEIKSNEYEEQLVLLKSKINDMEKDRTKLMKEFNQQRIEYEEEKIKHEQQISEMIEEHREAQVKLNMHLDELRRKNGKSILGKVLGAALIPLTGGTSLIIGHLVDGVLDYLKNKQKREEQNREDSYNQENEYKKKINH